MASRLMTYRIWRMEETRQSDEGKDTVHILVVKEGYFLFGKIPVAVFTLRNRRTHTSWIRGAILRDPDNDVALINSSKLISELSGRWLSICLRKIRWVIAYFGGVAGVIGGLMFLADKFGR